METLIFDEDHLKLYHNAEHHRVKAVWNGFISGNVFRHAVTFCTDVMVERNILYWLADNRKLKSMRQTDQDWLLKEIAPRMAASNLRKMATLVSDDIFNQLAIDTLFVKGNDMIRFDNHYFKTEEEALAWL